MPVTVEADVFAGNVSHWLGIVQSGTEVVVTIGGEPKGKLVPVPSEPPRKQRVLGLGAHIPGYWMAPDFDDPLPDSFWFGEDK